MLRGALSDYEYVAKLSRAGFDDIDIEPTRVYNINDARAFFSEKGFNIDELETDFRGEFFSGFIRATKPG